MKNLATILIVALLAISAVNAGGMQLQFGSAVARAVGASGSFAIVCSGGSGNYDYSFSGLPTGWSHSGNYINVPAISLMSGQSYTISVEVTDRVTG